MAVLESKSAILTTFEADLRRVTGAFQEGLVLVTGTPAGDGGSTKFRGSGPLLTEGQAEPAYTNSNCNAGGERTPLSRLFLVCSKSCPDLLKIPLSPTGNDG